MKKADFEQFIKSELRNVALEERKTWDETKLFTWFMKIKRENPDLTYDRCPGDPWQRVPGICQHLIGPRAL